MARPEPDKERAKALGDFIRAQRQLARLSLREMAALTKVSNPYLSQLERGLHEPSVRVLTAIAQALNLPAETLLTHSGVFDDEEQEGEGRPAVTTEQAIRSDPDLSDEQKRALLAVYRSYIAESRGS